MKKKHLTHQTEVYARKAHNILELNQTINDAILYIRGQKDEHRKPYYFVLDDKGHLIGYVSIRSLLLQDSETPLKDIIKTNFHVVHDKQTMFDALAIMQKFHLLSIPVISKGVFKGVIDIQEYFEEEVEMSSKLKRVQIFQMLGVLVEEGPTKTVWNKYLNRMPWVFCNMIGGIFCAVIADFYEVVLSKVIILAMFIPLVLALSESISMQVMTVSVYLMTNKKHSWKKILSYTFQEARLYVLIAFTASSTVGVLSLLWREGVSPAFVICMTIFTAIIVSAAVGALIPIILHRLKLDPKVASGPIVLMLVDMITTLIYLSLAYKILI
jgi:magnesium transporter